MGPFLKHILHNKSNTPTHVKNIVEEGDKSEVSMNLQFRLDGRLYLSFIVIKTWISNLVHTTRFWNDLHQGRSILIFQNVHNLLAFIWLKSRASITESLQCFDMLRAETI
jgi:hypothetical protein